MTAWNHRPTDDFERVSAELQAQRAAYELAVKKLDDAVIKALAEGDKVELRGFGSFKVKSRKSRKARNPRTGSSVEVPAKLVPYFKASNELKALVNK